MSRLRWRPRLFAALGAGFQNDPTVRDGVHLRWSLEPRLGLPHAPRSKGFDMAFLRTKEGSITRVDLFNASGAYPVRSNKTVLPAGPGIIHRDGNTLSFLRPLVAQDWIPHWIYFNRRAQLDALMPDRGEEERFLSYMDNVMATLGPESPTSFAEREDAVAVDVRFQSPGQPGGIGPIGPVVGGGNSLPFAFERRRVATRGSIFDRPVFDNIFDRFDRFRPHVFLTVQGYDHCGRLVAEDWVGRHPQVILASDSDPFPAQAGQLKLTARLRAAGIRTVKIIPRSGQAPLAEDEIRWVFCDEYASGRGLWANIDQEVLQADPGGYTPDWLRDDIYAPFRASSLPLGWAEMVARLKARFIGDPDIQDLMQTDDTFETWESAAKITDLDAPTGTSDDSVNLPLLSALFAAAVDPVVARLLGLYGHVPQNPDFQDRDWRIVVRPPFGTEDNLKRLDFRLRSLMDPGVPFFHQPGDDLTEFGLAGLVLNARESVKPPPPKPQPALETNVQLVPAKPDLFQNLVSATITAAPETMETQPWRVNACYEVIRGLTGELSENVLSDGQQGPLDDIGLLPDVLMPEFNRETCLSTGRLNDLFARDALVDRQLGYMVRGFDVFGRPSDVGNTPLVDLPAACLPPPPPGGVSTSVTRQGDLLNMSVDFDLGETATIVEADWQALEVLIHTIPLTEGVAPEATSWSGTRPGRLVELSFDAATLALQTTSVQQSCLRLGWTGGVLDRLPETETTCTATFPGQASVSLNASAVVGTGRKGYRMTLSLGSRTQYPDGLNAWCARPRVRGVCPTSGRVLHSPEVTVRGTLMLSPPPPQVMQPPIEALPLSTYPDALGTSYFNVNLRDVLNPADQTDTTLVKVYLARLEALTDHPEDFVTADDVIDPPGLISLARQSRARFSLVSDPPEVFDPHAPHTDIAVPGELSEVYVAAVQGANGLLETGSWQGAAFLPFRTPPLRPLPILDWITTGIEATGGTLRGTFSVAARFPAPLPDPAMPPFLQLFRRDLSAGQTQARFIDAAVGQSDDPGAARPEYLFDLTDDGVADWRRYEYAVQLLDFAPVRGQRIKVGGRVTRQIGAPSTGTRDPFATPTAVTVATDPGGGFIIDLDLAPGDFTVELEKVPDQGNATTRQCRIEAGRLFLPAGLGGILTTGQTCNLRLIDADTAPGLYTVRLRFGQSLTVSQDARTP